MLTTNALVGDLVPALDASIVPVRVHQIATQPLPAELQHEGRRHALHVARIDPLVKDGRFSIELVFDGEPPPLQVGQGLDVRLTLGDPAPALLLPDAGFYADTGGAWAFVLDTDGRQARRRPLQLGRRGDGVVEVLGGLQPGEQVVVSPYRAFAGAQALQLD